MLLVQKVVLYVWIGFTLCILILVVLCLQADECLGMVYTVQRLPCVRGVSIDALPGLW